MDIANGGGGGQSCSGVFVPAVRPIRYLFVCNADSAGDFFLGPARVLGHMPAAVLFCECTGAGLPWYGHHLKTLSI